MAKHELDLFENAIDSLAEALTKFEDGDAGNPKAYKFAVQHMAHFVELIFKHYIASKHPLLIFKDPFAAKLDRSKTINLWDAINFINNEVADAVSPDLRKDLEWLKRLRNDIEHHKFTMDVAEVRTTIGRLFRSVTGFLEANTDIDLETLIPKRTLDVFQLLSDEYEFALRSALREADEFEEAHPSDHTDPDSPPPRLDCDDCGNPTLILNDESSTGYRCLVCGNEVGDDVPASCDSCGVLTTMGELDVWKTEHGDESRCYYCSGRHHFDKDD